MRINKTLAVLASGALVAFAFTPAIAEESIVEQEKNQFDNSAQPDVPMGRGANTSGDPSIVQQEKNQFDNSAQPDVPMGKGANTSGDPSIVEQEQRTFAD